MSQINLLPWREEAREQSKKEYLSLLGAVALGAVVLLFAWISFARIWIAFSTPSSDLNLAAM